MKTEFCEFEETEYGAYIGNLKCNLLGSNIQFTDNFDVLDYGNIRLVISKASRYPGDDLDNVFGINFYRKCPSFEEALEYWNNLPQALTNSKFCGNLAFAAKDESDYLKKLNVYQAFYDTILNPLLETTLILVAPHSGDIRRVADNVTPNPYNDIDLFSGRTTIKLFEELRDFSPKEKTVCFMHTSSDHFKSFPAAIDIGDMGNEFSPEFKNIIHEVNQEFKQRLSNEYFNLIENTVDRTFGVYSEKLSKYGTIVEEELKVFGDEFAIQHSNSRFKEFSINPSVVFDKSLFKNELEKLDIFPQLMINHPFSGRGILKQINSKGGFEDSGIKKIFQFEYSEILQKKSSKLLAELTNTLIRRINE